MKADEAYKIASENANIENELAAIQREAAKGNYSVTVSRLSDAQQNKLRALGYMIGADWSAAGHSAISGRWSDKDCSHQSISWFSPTVAGIDSLRGLMK